MANVTGTSSSNQQINASPAESTELTAISKSTPADVREQAQKDRQYSRSLEIASDRIFGACDGLTSKADRSEIFDALERMPAGAGDDLRSVYQKRYGRSLDADLKENLFAAETRRAFMLLNSDRIGLASDALETALKNTGELEAPGGVLARNPGVVEVLKGLTFSEQKEVLADYKQRTGMDFFGQVRAIQARNEKWYRPGANRNFQAEIEAVLSPDIQSFYPYQSTEKIIRLAIEMSPPRIESIKHALDRLNDYEREKLLKVFKSDDGLSLVGVLSQAGILEEVAPQLAFRKIKSAADSMERYIETGDADRLKAVQEVNLSADESWLAEVYQCSRQRSQAPKTESDYAKLAQEMAGAIEGAGSREKTIFRIAAGLTREEWIRLRATYEITFKRELQKDIEGELSKTEMKHFRELRKKADSINSAAPGAPAALSTN